MKLIFSITLFVISVHCCTQNNDLLDEFALITCGSSYAPNAGTIDEVKFYERKITGGYNRYHFLPTAAGQRYWPSIAYECSGNLGEDNAKYVLKKSGTDNVCITKIERAGAIDIPRFSDNLGGRHMQGRLGDCTDQNGFLTCIGTRYHYFDGFWLDCLDNNDCKIWSRSSIWGCSCDFDGIDDVMNLVGDDNLNYRRVALKSHHSKYLAAEFNGNANANRNTIGSWEKWGLIMLPNNKIALHSYHGTYLVAESNGDANANRELLGSWEKWEMIDAGSGKYAFKSAHGKYLVAESTGALNANRDTMGSYEKFEIMDV